MKIESNFSFKAGAKTVGTLRFSPDLQVKMKTVGIRTYPKEFRPSWDSFQIAPTRCSQQARETFLATSNIKDDRAKRIDGRINQVPSLHRLKVRGKVLNEFSSEIRATLKRGSSSGRAGEKKEEER